VARSETALPLSQAGTLRSWWQAWVDSGVALKVLSVGGFLFLWQVLARNVNPILVPTPTRVAAAFVQLLRSGELQTAFLVSLQDLGYGYLLAVAVGLLVGTLMGRFRAVENTLSPFVNFFMATPTVALVPLVIIWFGFGTIGRVALVFKVSVWTILINTLTGVKTTNRLLREVAMAFRLNERQYVRWVALPNALPYVFAGLKLGLGKAIIGMIVAEMTMQLSGLGGLVMNYGNAFKTAHLIAGVATSSLFAVIVLGVMDLIQGRLFPWIEGTSSQRE